MPARVIACGGSEGGAKCATREGVRVSRAEVRVPEGRTYFLVLQSGPGSYDVLFRALKGHESQTPSRLSWHFLFPTPLTAPRRSTLRPRGSPPTATGRRLPRR